MELVLDMYDQYMFDGKASETARDPQDRGGLSPKLLV